MENPRVHWYEGMFIGPHHFQANDRYWNSRLAMGSRWDKPHNYGIRCLEFDDRAIGHGMVVISKLEARFPDGTEVSFGQGRVLGSYSFIERFEGQQELYIFLCVRSHMEYPNTGDSDRRYSSKEATFCDEDTGDNDRVVDVRVLNCYLMAVPVGAQHLGNPDVVKPKGVECLPLMRICRTNSDEALPRLDPGYFPPMIETEAWSALADKVLRTIYHLVGQNMSLLARRVKNRGLTFSGARGEGELDDLVKLTVLNRNYALMRNYCADGRSIHPEQAYHYLCLLYGELAVFDREHRCVDGELPAYDHDRLQYIFVWLKVRIESLVKTTELRYEHEDFVGAGDRMDASLRAHWFQDDWSWYVGVRGVTPQELELLKATLNWKMASVRQIDAIFNDRLVGLTLTVVKTVPRSLPDHEGWIYHEVVRRGGPWQDVELHRTIALKVNQGLVSNITQWNNQTKMALGEKTLEFRLFAVPPSNSL